MPESPQGHQHRRLDNRGHIGVARRIVGLFGPYRVLVAVVGLLIVVNAALGVVNPVLIKEVFDSALFPAEGGLNLTLLWLLAGLMAAIAVVGGALNIAQTYLTGRVGQDVTGDLQEAVYDHLLGMSVTFLARTRTGEMQSRVSHDINGIEPVVTNTFADSIASLASLIAVVVAMLLLSWQFTLVALAALPVFFLLTRWVGRKRRELLVGTQASMAQVTAVTEETLSLPGILLAKLFGRQHAELHHFRRHNEELSRFAVRQQMLAQSFYTAANAFLALSPALVYLLAGYLIFMGGAGAVTAGTIIAFTALADTALPSGGAAAAGLGGVAVVRWRCSSAIFGYLDLEQEITDATNAIRLDKDEVRGEVAFESVRVDNSRYRGSDGDLYGSEQTRQWALDEVTFRIEPGQLAAFVGPSGAGKTSIAALVPRLYDATEGTVSIDGIDVRRIRLEDLAATVGFVTQESYLLQTSIEENLRYARPDATDDEVESAAKAAYIHDRIMELPAGYATVVGERGFGLSIGERQRLSIARTLLHQPRILILDEATSALDMGSERRLQSALRPLVEGRTTLVIAHRLSTILAADVIFVITEGRVKEYGTHEELLER